MSERRLRIALVSRFGYPCVGGTEAVVRTLAAGLGREHDVTCLAQRIDDDGIEWKNRVDQVPRWGPQRDPLSGIETRWFGLSDARLRALTPLLHSPRSPERFRAYQVYLEGMERYYVALARSGYAGYFRGNDVVHRFGGSVVSLAITRAAHHAGKAVVITPFAHPGQWGEDKLSVTAYRESDRVIATNDVDKRTYTALGVPEHHVAICPPAVPAPRSGGGLDIRDRYGIRGPLILFLGVRRAYKGIDLLLEALAVATRRIPEVHLAVLGPGPPLPAGHPRNALDIGEVTEAERDAWLDAASIVALPSANESFGLAVSEAWAAGVPVVTSDIEVLKGRVEACGGGLAVPREADAIAGAIGSLLLDRDLRQEMGRRGHGEWQASLSPEAVTAWHLSLYQSLLEDRPLPQKRGRRRGKLRSVG